jgi:hypothetical protein
MNHGAMDDDLMGMAHRCNMNVDIRSLLVLVKEEWQLTYNPQMLFTWDTENLCIIFRWWHVSGTPTLLLSLFAIVVLTAGYEAIRNFSRRYERWSAKKQDEVPSTFPPTHLSSSYVFLKCGA